MWTVPRRDERIKDGEGDKRDRAGAKAVGEASEVGSGTLQL